LLPGERFDRLLIRIRWADGREILVRTNPYTLAVLDLVFPKP
jgi:hypothetical protein